MTFKAGEQLYVHKTDLVAMHIHSKAINRTSSHLSCLPAKCPHSTVRKLWCCVCCAPNRSCRHRGPTHQLAIMSDERPSDALQPNAKRRAAGQGSKDDVEEEEEVRQHSFGGRTAHASL